MMEPLIAPGTPCFLVRCTDYPINGRVVEVICVSPVPVDGPGVRYVVDADWLREMFDGRECQARPENLIPIIPPAPADVKSEGVDVAA
jgi:hypothetical protein